VYVWHKKILEVTKKLRKCAEMLDRWVCHFNQKETLKVKGKVFPYSLPSVGPGADPGVQAVSPQVT